MRILTLLTVLMLSFALTFPASAADDLKIRIVEPGDGEFISGVVPVSVEMISGEGIESVALFVDGKELASIDKAPWTYDWNVDDWSVGDHELKAVAEYAGRSATAIVNIETGPQMKLVDLGDGSYDVGETVVIALQVNRVTGINGVNFRLEFESEKLEFLSCDQRRGFDGGNFLGSPLFLGTLAEPGLVACNATIKKGDPTQTGSGNVAYISFKVKSAETAKLGLINSVKYVKCIDADGELLPVNVTRGLVIND